MPTVGELFDHNNTLVTLRGPTCKAGTFHMDVKGPFTIRVLENIIKQLEIYKAFLVEDEAEAASAATDDLQKEAEST